MGGMITWSCRKVDFKTFNRPREEIKPKIRHTPKGKDIERFVCIHNKYIMEACHVLVHDTFQLMCIKGILVRHEIINRTTWINVKHICVLLLHLEKLKKYASDSWILKNICLVMFFIENDIEMLVNETRLEVR